MATAVWRRLWIIPCGLPLMLRAPPLKCLSLDPFSLQQDDLAAPEVEVGGREVAEVFVTVVVLVVSDEPSI